MICEILQIGDQLGDQESSAFAKVMSEKLEEADWSDPEQAALLQSHILSMNSNLQAQVLLANTNSGHSFWTSFEQWPMALQHVRFWGWND